MATFSAVGVSSTLIVPAGQKFRVALSGTWVGMVQLQRRFGNGFVPVREFRANEDITVDPCAQDEAYRLHCIVYTSGTITYTLAVSTVPQLQKLLDRFDVEQFAVDENGARAAILTLSSLLFLTGVENSLTAHAGGGKASALALSATKSIHRVSTVGSGDDSVLMPPALAGAVHVLINSGANSMQVFGQGTDTIDDVATATGVAHAAGKGALYVCVVDGKWYRVLGA